MGLQEEVGVQEEEEVGSRLEAGRLEVGVEVEVGEGGRPGEWGWWLGWWSQRSQSRRVAEAAVGEERPFLQSVPRPGAGAEKRTPPDVCGVLGLRLCPALPALTGPRGERRGQQRRGQQRRQQGALWKEMAHQESGMRRGGTQCGRKTEGEPWGMVGEVGWVVEVGWGKRSQQGCGCMKW